MSEKWKKNKWMNKWKIMKNINEWKKEIWWNKKKQSEIMKN